MINVRPSNPVYTVEDVDPTIARFEDSEWRDLIELARHYGFEPPDDHAYDPQEHNRPVEIDPGASQGLWEAASAAYKDDAVPSGASSREVGRLRVNQLVECAQIGAEQGGIEIRHARDQDPRA